MSQESTLTIAKPPATRIKMIYVIGARQAGKSVLMEAATGREPILNRYSWETEVFLRVKDMRIMLATVGGRERYRALSHHQLRRSKAVIAVLDANNMESIEETIGLLRQVHPLVTSLNIPLAIVANVKDAVNCMSEQDIKKALNLELLLANVEWVYFQFSCASVSEVSRLVEWLHEETSKRELVQETVTAAQKAVEDISTSWSKKLYNWLSGKGVAATSK